MPQKRFGEDVAAVLAALGFLWLPLLVWITFAAGTLLKVVRWSFGL